MTMYNNSNGKRKSLVIFWVCCTGTFIAGWFSLARAGEVSAENELVDKISETENWTGPMMAEWVQEQTGLSLAVLERVQGMLETARAEKDTIKITCLDDKMTQIHVSYRGVEERSDSLDLTIGQGDIVSAKQIFSILKIYFSRIHSLSFEAENCLGESDVVLGKTESTMYISDDVTVMDPSAEDISDDFGVEQPAHMSAYF